MSSLEERDFLPIVWETSALTAALEKTSAVRRTREQYFRGRPGRYTAKTQPRDQRGKFRKILARLKSNLGDTELEQITQEIRAAQRAEDAGDYAAAARAGATVIKMVDDIETGVLDQNVEKNLRSGAAELGKVLAHLPLPQGIDTAKVRFSDLPPATSRFIDEMIDRVKNEVEASQARKFLAVITKFKSGVQTMSSDELSAELNKLLRLLVD